MQIELADIRAESRRYLAAGHYRPGLDRLMQLHGLGLREASLLSDIGAALFHLGRIRAAERWLRRALLDDPGHQGARLNLANAYTRLGRDEEAETLFCALLEEKDVGPLVAANYGNYLLTHERHQEAEPLLRQAAELAPDLVTSWVNLALLLSQTSRSSEAIAALKRALALNPHHGLSHLLMGEQLANLSAFEKAKLHLERVLELMPPNLVNLTALATVQASLSETGRAQVLFAQALALAPESWLAQLNARLLLPVIPSSAEVQAKAVADLETGLAVVRELLDQSPGLGSDQKAGSQANSQEGGWQPGIQPVEVQPHLFHLAYRNADVRASFKAYFEILARLFSVPSRAAAPRPKPRSGGDRLRIGFASQYFYFHSNSRAFEGLIRYLDREQFEVVIIHGPSSTEDAIRRRIDATAQEVVQLVEDPGEALAQLQALDLQILFYTDLGMNMFMNALAMHRVAPIQITGWGIPHTSGLRSLDYYISSALTEPEGAEQHYTEQLVRLPALPCCYLAENLELIEVPRDYFFLPPTGPIVGCLQSLYKLHPDFDLALEQIAIANPDALFVFVESPHASLTRAFQQRLKERAPTLSEQMVFLAIMNHKHFVALSNCMDLLLDPFYYCSGITFYESSYTGTPTVTLEGQYMRGRYVAGAYRHLGLPNAPIATSEEEYVQIANHLIRDPEALATLRADLRRLARAHLYDDLRTVRSFETFCRQAWAQACAADAAVLPAVQPSASASHGRLLQDSSEAAA